MTAKRREILSQRRATNVNIFKGSEFMLLPASRIISLAFLLVGSIIPVTTTAGHAAKGDVLSDVSWDDPQTVRHHVVEKSYDKYKNNLVRGLADKVPSPDTANKISTIEYLRVQGEAVAQTNEEFKDFVPKISNSPTPQADEVNICLAAAGFLTESLSSFQGHEGKSDKIRGSVVNTLESLLTLRGGAKKSKGGESQFRDATNAERKIILAATAEIAREHYNQNKARDYGFDYWKAHFSRQHHRLEGDKTVQATVNTRATAAALVWVALQNVVDTLQSQVDAILSASGMSTGMFANFVSEINQATGEKLANILANWSQGSLLQFGSGGSAALSVAANASTEILLTIAKSMLLHSEELKGVMMVEDKNSLRRAVLITDSEIVAQLAEGHNYRGNSGVIVLTSEKNLRSAVLVTDPEIITRLAQKSVYRDLFSGITLNVDGSNNFLSRGVLEDQNGTTDGFTTFFSSNQKNMMLATIILGSGITLYVGSQNEKVKEEGGIFSFLERDRKSVV